MAKRVLILNLLVLFASALISVIIPLRDEIVSALGLINQSQIDFIDALFLMVGAITSIIWAILGDRYSRKRLLIIGTIIWSSFSFITIFSFDFYSLLVFQIIAAVGFGSALPLAFSLLVDLVKKEKRATAFGRLSAVYVLGNGLGLVLATLSETKTWFIPFIVISICGIICVLFLSRMTEPRKEMLEGDPKLEDESVLGMGYKIKVSDFKDIFRRKSIFLIILFNFIMFVGIGAFAPQFSNMLEGDYLYPFFPLESLIATVLMIIIYGSQMISGIIIGNIADKGYVKDKKRRVKFILICLVIGSIADIIAYSLFFDPSNLAFLVLFIILLFIGTFFFGGIDPLTQATLGDVSPSKIKSTVYSLNFIAYNFGRSISLLLFGYLFLYYGSVYRIGFLILSLIALSTSILVLFILKILPRDLLKKASEISKIEKE
jgi:MFS family permease